ncbi:MAG: hypothetical protein QOE28_636, partial [Solirubrobacteraceae bacterium]|nr:hypothetical protein [Solirubrobacteraceae bacterium]
MRSRAAVLAVPALLGPGLLACFAGGYGDRARLVAGIAAWLILAVAALVLPRPLPRGRAQWAALAGLAGLAAWTAASLSWTPVGEPAGKDVQRLVLYVGALAAGIAILRARAAARLAEPLLLAGVTAACLYGLSDRLLPSVFHLERVLSAGDRLAQPLTYWNATGAFAALGLLLAAGIAGDRGRPGALRAAAAGCAPPLGLALYLTFSRGALGALAAGFAVLIAVAPERARLRAAAVVIAGAALPSVATVALPAVATADSGPKQGPAMLLLLLGLAGAAALVQRAAREDAPAPLPGLRIAALAGLALALAVTGYAVSRVEHGSGTDSPAASPSRLASVQSNRYAYWRVAIRTFGDHPLRGEGSGGFATV